MAVGVVMAVVKFRLGRDADVLVCRSQKSSASGCNETGVRKDDGNAGVEEIVAVENFGGVVGAPRTAEVVCCYYGGVDCSGFVSV